MRTSALLLAILAAACGGGGGGDQPAGDGGPDGASNGDAGADAMADAHVCQPYVVFLNFDGLAITKGTEDATLDRAGWLIPANATIPAFAMGAGSRQTRIDAIVDQIVGTIPFTIPATYATQRPPNGPYDMIVFGGAPANVGLTGGRGFGSIDCDRSIASNLSVVYETGLTDIQMANEAILRIGVANGLSFTSTADDCLCGTCNTTTECTLNTNAVVETAAACPGAGATQDDLAALAAGLCW